MKRLKRKTLLGPITAMSAPFFLSFQQLIFPTGLRRGVSRGDQNAAHSDLILTRTHDKRNRGEGGNVGDWRSDGGPRGKGQRGAVVCPVVHKWGKER